MKTILYFYSLLRPSRILVVRYKPAYPFPVKSQRLRYPAQHVRILPPYPLLTAATGHMHILLREYNIDARIPEYLYDNRLVPAFPADVCEPLYLTGFLYKDYLAFFQQLSFAQSLTAPPSLPNNKCEGKQDPEQDRKNPVSNRLPSLFPGSTGNAHDPEKHSDKTQQNNSDNTHAPFRCENYIR